MWKSKDIFILIYICLISEVNCTFSIDPLDLILGLIN